MFTTFLIEEEREKFQHNLIYLFHLLPANLVREKLFLLRLTKPKILGKLFVKLFLMKSLCLVIHTEEHIEIFAGNSAFLKRRKQFGKFPTKLFPLLKNSQWSCLYEKWQIYSHELQLESDYENSFG
jgi:hypothetical protein